MSQRSAVTSEGDDPNQSWHAMNPERVLSELETGLDGLTTDEAAARLAKYGENRLQVRVDRGAFRRLARQFHNVLIYVLLASAVVTALLAHWVDTAVIIGVVVVNALVGFVQEGKAERALEALSKLLAQRATVRRAGAWHTVSASELVPGDLVSLQPGDKVPADLRLVRARELRVDESSLTGESVPVEKAVAAVPAQTVVADRSCIAHSGTMVTSGSAWGTVIATGGGTELGRISELMYSVPTLVTPLLRKIGQFSRWLTGAILVLSTVTFAFGIYVRDYQLADMFIAAVGLAVAAIPEGLPAILTITLAIGVQRMAKRNAIVRRLPAVETLGSVTVICSDKTGTLTCNEMTVRSVALRERTLQVGGEGYVPHGGFSSNEEAIDPAQDDELMQLSLAALLCNDADVHYAEDGWQISGDPTEVALTVLALKTGLAKEQIRAQYPRVDEIPFESQHRYMATMHHDHLGHSVVYVKGAPERVLDMCDREQTAEVDQALDREAWEYRARQLAQEGLRVLALARKRSDEVRQALQFSDTERGFTLLGLIGMLDPPREEAVAAIRQCHTAGISVKMITGDHAHTAQAIARSMGLGEQVMAGAELDSLSDEGLREKAVATDVFARASPEHKLRLVQALQADGNVVAMTGDGVNDAPALRRADVGIAMGTKGTEVAKEAAEIVLADDNFASISEAVAQGRTVYDNLKKAILFILPTNGGEALTILAAVLVGRELPITAAQILWVNMVTAVTLGLALAFEPAEDDLMRRPPRAPREPILSRFLVWRTVSVAVILLLGTYGLFSWYRDQGADLEKARTIAVNTLVCFEIFYLFSCRQISRSAFTRQILVGNPFVHYAVGLLAVLQLLFTYAPPMQLVFATVGLALTDWLRIVGVAAGVLILVELEKALSRRWQRS